MPCNLSSIPGDPRGRRRKRDSQKLSLDLHTHAHMISRVVCLIVSGWRDGLVGNALALQE